MATAMSKQKRVDILDNIISKTFAERKKQLNDLSVKVADEAYKAVVPQAFVDFAALAGDSDWVARSNVVVIRLKDCSGRVTGYTKLGGDSYFEMTRRCPFPNGIGGGGSTPYLYLHENNQDHAGAINVVKEMHETNNKYNEMVADMRVRVSALLASFTTVEKFIEAAPELADHIPSHIYEKKISLPAVAVDGVISSLIAAGLKVPGKE